MNNESRASSEEKECASGSSCLGDARRRPGAPRHVPAPGPAPPALDGGSTQNIPGTHESLKKHHNYHRSNIPRNAQQAKSCGNLESDISSEPTLFKVVQYPSKQEVLVGTSSSYSGSGSGEYYKRYDHDAVPVKDTLTSETSTDSGSGERLSLTESHLNNIELNISEDLKTYSSQNTMDSSIKVFKVMVEEIFNKFYANMHDIELYKKKFHEILNKDQGECVEEMEDFVKEMIRHIMSSESSDLNEEKCDDKKEDELEDSKSSVSKLEDLQFVMEAFKNENYFLDSQSDEKGNGSKQEWQDKTHNPETLNIYLMSKNPCVKIKMNNNNNHLSEIQIMDRCNRQDLNKTIASADDMKMLAAKKKELADWDTRVDTRDNGDREIPIKISFAKKNIHADEETHRESNRCERSFLGHVCSYLCKKLRKATNLGM